MATRKGPMPLLVRAKETTPPSVMTGGRLASDLTAASGALNSHVIVVQSPTDGMSYRLTVEQLAAIMATTDPMLEIARGNVSLHGQVNKFGGNLLVASGATEDIWDGGGTYAFPTTASITHINQAVDQAALRGETVEVQGLDTNWDLVVQNVTIDASNSTTPVALTTALRRVFRMKVLADVVTNQNVIAHDNASPQVISSQITAGNNQTLMAIYTVPNGYTAYITRYYASTTESTGKEPKSTEFKLWVADRANNYEFQLKHAVGIPKAGSGVVQEFRPYMKVNTKNDIKMSAAADSEDAAVHAGFDIILINE